MGVLQKFLSENVNDAMLRIPQETQNLHQRVIALEASRPLGSQGDTSLESVVDKHQDWQNQVEIRLSDLVQDQQVEENRINERFNDQFAQSHSVNERLMEKLMGLERTVEEQRVQILHLESNARVAKTELHTPDKSTPRQLFPEMNPSASHPQNDTSGNSAGSHSQSVAQGNPLGSDPSDPPGSHSMNDTEFNSLCTWQSFATILSTHMSSWRQSLGDGCTSMSSLHSTSHPMFELYHLHCTVGNTSGFQEVFFGSESGLSLPLIQVLPQNQFGE